MSTIGFGVPAGATTACYCVSSKKHFRQTAHPVIRSLEPGERWRWCYVDRRVV